MNIEEFIAKERHELHKESERLASRQSSGNSAKRISLTKTSQSNATGAPTNTTISQCPAEQLLQSPLYQPKACRRAKSADSTQHRYNKNNANMSQIRRGNELPRINSAKEERRHSPVANTIVSSLATDDYNNDDSDVYDDSEHSKATEATSTFMMYTTGGPEAGNDNNAARLVPVNFHLDLDGIKRGEKGYKDIDKQATVFQKSAKNLVNECELLASNSARSVSNYGESPQDQNAKEEQKQQQQHRQHQRSLSENHKDTLLRERKKDDMEQWVTDTFYSYFPGYSNENEKRQNYLRERQLENQQNFLKHQMLNPPLKKHAQKITQKQQTSLQTTTPTTTTTPKHNMNTQGSNNSNNTTPSTTDKTDLEIIVNNPNYVPPKYLYMNGKTKPSATRRKLLQDLDHVGLSNIVTGDGIVERNRRSAELETARKRDYQRDLMQQIDEKRRSIELLREKERKQEEALTRRLESQLKAMKVEEQIEKERLRKEKARLIAKLENDSKILHAKQQQQQKQQLLKQTPVISKQVAIATAGAAALNIGGGGGGVGVSSSSHNINRANITDSNNSLNNNVMMRHADKDNNKVYKYFSNSARHEYRRGQPMPVDVEFELEIPDMMKIERECFHLCEKICPMCDEPLKSYESCCLRCQRKLALRIKKGGNKSKSKSKRKANTNGLEKTSDDVTGTGDDDGDIDDDNKTKSMPADISVDNNGNEDNYDDDADDDEEGDHPLESCRSTYALVCLKCERLYALCTTCLAKSDVCRACHQKRNICMNCRRTLCTFCLEEIACGRDTERTHVNDSAPEDNIKQTNGDAAFRVLELNYAAKKDTELMDEQTDAAEISASSSSPLSSPLQVKHLHENIEKIHNKFDEDSSEATTITANHPPYSMNFAPNSIFHPDYKHVAIESIEKFDEIPIIVDRSLSIDWDSESDKEAALERVRREADKRLSRYVKNYGDLVERLRSKSESKNRSTQTTPLTSRRRDVVMNEGTQNLSMPLLREMPKMTRHDSTLNQNATNNTMINRKKIDNLKRRWEVPAVQKFTISKTSPKVLTQVGAIRKQLQAERFFNEDD